MKKLRNYVKWWPYLVGYIMFAVFFKVTPIFFDMWVEKTDYIVRGCSFAGVLKAVFFTGGCWKNARYLANVINIYVVSYEWMFDFLIPLVFVGSMLLMQRLMGAQRVWPIILMGVGLLFDVSDGIIGQVYSYSYVLFLLPILFCVCIIYCLEAYMADETFLKPIYRKVLFCILIYLNACFLENVSCAFTVTLAGYYFKEKFILKRKGTFLLGGCILSTVQTLYMNLYLIILKTRPLSEDNVGLFERIIRNGRLLLIETWIYNVEIVCVFLIAVCTALLVKKDISAIKKKILLLSNVSLLILYVLYICLIYIPNGLEGISTSIGNDFYVTFLPFSYRGIQTFVFIASNLYILYVIYLLDAKLAVLFWMGGCSLIPILITPNTGWRISSFYVFMMIYVSIGLLMKVAKEESRSKNIFIMVLSLIIFVGASFGYIERINRIISVSGEIEVRVEDVKRSQEEGKWDLQNDILYLPPFDSRDILYGGRPDLNEYYMWNYCIANGLEKETKILSIVE